MSQVILQTLFLASLTSFIHSTDNMALNEFAVKTAANLYSPGQNFVYSPASSAFAVGMLLEGANGTSRQEIVISLFGKNENGGMSLLRWSLPDSKSGLTFNVANFLYSRKSFPLRESFIKSLKTNYRAIGRELDFGTGEAVQIVNNDVKTATEGMIPEFLKKIPGETMAMIVNAIYFKGKWTSKFDKEDTIEKDFYLSSGKTVQVPMMYQKGKFRTVSDSQTRSKTLILPYASTSSDYVVCMVIVLPDPGQNISKFLADFDAKAFTDSLDAAEMTRDLRVRLPRFKLESSHSLIPTLGKLGIQQVFSGQADLSRMSDKGKLRVSEVFQKAVIEVNEEGTEAAAATAIEIVLMSSGYSPPDPEFNVDRPFLYALVSENSSVKNILFVGAVENPLSS